MAKMSISILFFLFSFASFAQRKLPVTDYPKDYFRNPLDIPILLAGNFGECRPGHFHSGIDIKTLGEENQPVHAAADGYVSRIKMEKGGFGHGLYITHPNGYTTLYAHLNDFSPAIQKYVREQQYEQQMWQVDLQLSPSQFPVKKGQLVAYSGNTGASTAPHLHFEIRNTKTEHPLNPQQFGLHIVDKVAPVPLELVLYPGYWRNTDHDNIPASIYENPKISVKLLKKDSVFNPFKTDNKNYTIIKDTIDVPAKLFGIGINAGDYMDGSDNILTFYKARLLMDDELQAEVTLDDIGYDETRYINAYVDYGLKKESNKWVQCLYKLKGNKLGHLFTSLNAANGRLAIKEGTIHKIEIILTDNAGNNSYIHFYARGKDATGVTLRDQILEYYNSDSVNTFNEVHNGKRQRDEDFDYDPNVSFTLDNRQLYDDFYFNFRKEASGAGYSDKYSIHYPEVPIHHYFDLKLKPTRPVPFGLRSKMVMIYSDGKSEEGAAATPTDNGWYKTAVRSFGTYWLETDTMPPVIKSQQKQGAILTKAKQLTFDIRDVKTSVKKFNGYIDDKWVCVEQHGNSFFYKFDGHCPKGKHSFVIKAEDESGNTAITTLKFTR